MSPSADATNRKQREPAVAELDPSLRLEPSDAPDGPADAVAGPDPAATEDDELDARQGAQVEDEESSEEGGEESGEEEPDLEYTIRPKPALLLKSLDRMLTIGSYYPPGHEKYREVSEETHAALVATAAHDPCVAIEITDAGLSLLGGFIAADAREAARLHQMLNPLHVALLEIDTAATIEDLHQALITLKKHHGALAGVRAYDEVTIKGLPATVRTTSRSLYVKLKAGGGHGGGQGEPGTRSYGEAWDPNTIPDALLVPTPDGQKMEREFMAVVRGIITSGDPVKKSQLQGAPDEMATEVLAEWVPDRAIKAIKDVLDALAATNSDPLLLSHLIGHAKAALDLTGKADMVELIFDKLRKEQEKKAPGSLMANRPKPRSKKNPVVFTMTREQLREAIAEVEKETRPVADLMADTSADCLGICYQVLVTAPSELLVEGVQEMVRNLIAADDFLEKEKDLKIIIESLRSAVRGDSTESADLVVEAITAPMREVRPTKLGWLWLAMWEGLFELEHKEMAWPYVVNDILLGLEWPDQSQKISLYQAVTALAVKERIDLLVRLEALPALQEKILAEDLFAAPAPLLYPVHQLLLRSSLSEVHGPRLLASLTRHRAHPLVILLLKSLGPYDRSQQKLYQAMLDQGVGEEVVPTLEDAAFRYLKAIITRLEDEELNKTWVPRAIMWLGRLNPARAEDVLRDILGEKKWLFFPVWPKPAREAAKMGLAALAGKVRSRKIPLDDGDDDD